MKDDEHPDAAAGAPRGASDEAAAMEGDGGGAASPAGKAARARGERTTPDDGRGGGDRGGGDGAEDDGHDRGGDEVDADDGRGGGDRDADDGRDDAADLLRRAAAELRGMKELEAFVPLTAAERASLVDDVMASVMARETASASTEPAAPVTAPASTGPAAPILPLRRRPTARLVVGAAVAVAALAATLALLLRGREHGAAPLVAYEMTVEGERETRGEPSPSAEPARQAPVEVRPQTQLSIALTPARPERDALLRLVLVRGERAVLLEPSLQARRDGALVITGAASELLGPQADGEVQLVALLGRRLPDDETVLAIARGQRAPPASVQRLQRPLRLVGFSHSVNSSASPEALLAGCRAVLAGQGGAAVRCQVAAGSTLQLWVGATRGLEVLVDGEVQEFAGEARGGGTLLQMPVVGEPRALAVRVGGAEVLARQLEPAPSFPWMPAYDAALAEQQLEWAAAALPPAAASPEEELELARRRAKLAWRQGQLDEAGRQRGRAVALARQLGNVSAESDEIVAQLYGLIDDHQLAAAAQLVTALDRHGTTYPEGAMYRDLTHGRLASELGDLGAALGWMRRAQSIAARLDHARAMGFIRAPLGEVLASLGRSQEVRALVEEEVERGRRDADPCARVDALTSSGWLLRDADRGRAQQLVDEAVELADARCAERLPITLVNRGWLLAERGQTAEARRVLARLEALPPDGEGRVLTWQLRLEAEVLLGEDPRAAERHAGQLLARADALCSAELRYEALLLRGRGQHARGERALAMASFDEAERALAQWSRTVPLGEGRETFFRRHDQLALAAIPLLLEQIERGDAAAALRLAQAVRRSLARFTSSLAGGSLARASAERGDHERDERSARMRGPDKAHCTSAAPPADDPSAPLALGPQAPPSQLSLFLHPMPRGWIAVAWQGSRVASAVIDEVAQPGELGGRLVTALVTALDALRSEPPGAPDRASSPAPGPSPSRVHLYVHRTVAALPLDRLLAAALASRGAFAVAFAVDVAPRAAATTCAAAPRALIVSNPQGNLWAASEAMPVVRAQLERRGFSVEVIEGAAVTRAALQARFADPCLRLLHYDGHGAAPGSLDRLDDALLLADGERLTAAGVLGLARVPPLVVLNGCTTAAPEGLGLAQAFLVAGAAQVVASLEELSAAEAARFTRELYRGEGAAAALDLVSLFGAAIAARDVPAMRAFER